MLYRELIVQRPYLEKSFSSQKAEKNGEAQVSLPRSTKGLNVGKPEDASAQIFTNQWLGFTISVTHKDKVEERK